MGCIHTQSDTNTHKLLQNPHLLKFFTFTQNLNLFQNQIYYDQSLFNTKSQVKQYSIQQKIKLSIHKIYTGVSTTIFQKYSVKHIQYSKIRLLFCSSILLNICSLIKNLKINYHQFWQNNCLIIYNMIKQQSLSIIDKLLKKYPVTMKAAKQTSIGNTIKSFNNMFDLKYSCFKDQRFKFFQLNNRSNNSKKTKIQINQIYKKFVNILIDQSRQQINFFKQTMTQIFGTKVKFLIGCKFTDKVQKYTQQQIMHEQFYFKSSQVLRIFIKWMENLQQSWNQQTLIAQLRFNVKKQLNRFLQTDIPQFKQEKITSQQKQFFFQNAKLNRQFLQGLHKQIQSIRSQLYIYYFYRIQNLQTNKLFTNQTIQISQLVHLISKSLPNYTIDALQTSWNNLNLEIDDGGVSLVQKSIDLTSFRIGDLLRSKCSGTQLQIKDVYNRLQSNPNIELIRVKNRLAYGTKDMLINFKLKKSFIWCEVQLQCVSEDGLQDLGYFQAKFNHFLYQLKRSKFGPLTQSAMILFFQDQRFHIWPHISQDIKFQNIFNLPSKYPVYKIPQILSRLPEGQPKMICPNKHQMKYFGSIPFYCNYCSTQEHIQIKQDQRYLCHNCEKCLLSICNKCSKERLQNY